MRKILLLAALFVLHGCGTATTLTNTDSELKMKLNKNSSSCVEMTRVYSGVAYDLCRLHSTPDHSFYNPFLVAYLVDMPFSAITDTVALPFTIYSQSNNGSINVEN
jgi:uncharacterized protein YceK